MSVAFWKASSRKQNLKIEVSADGVNFEQVFSGQSSYTTDTLEPFTFTKRAVKAVKITCNGNTSTDAGANKWNSILEVVTIAK